MPAYTCYLKIVLLCVIGTVTRGQGMANQHNENLINQFYQLIEKDIFWYDGGNAQYRVQVHHITPR